jgi:hypothetical protein
VAGVSAGFWGRLEGAIDYLKAVAEAAGDDPAKVDEMTPTAMVDATLVPNGDGTFALSTGNLRLDRLGLHPPMAGMTHRPMPVRVTGYETDAEGSWTVKMEPISIEAAIELVLRDGPVSPRSTIRAAMALGFPRTEVEHAIRAEVPWGCIRFTRTANLELIRA